MEEQVACPISQSLWQTVEGHTNPFDLQPNFLTAKERLPVRTNFLLEVGPSSLFSHP